MKRKFYEYCQDLDYKAYPKNNKKKRKIEDDDSNSDSDVDECDNSCSAKNNNVYSKGNHIYFHSSVNKKSIEMLIGEINKINREFEKIKENDLVEIVRPKPIYLHITSFGGSIFHCFKAIDVMERSKIEVHTVVEGYAASCGSLMSVVGKKRYMGKRANILIHQLSSVAFGKYREIEDTYQSCKMFMEQIIKIYQDNTNMSREQIEQQLEHDLWWNFETCIENGLIDEEWIDI